MKSVTRRFFSPVVALALIAVSCNSGSSSGGSSSTASTAAEPSVTVTGDSTVEADFDNVPVAFTAMLSAPSEEVITVDFATEDGTALSTSDYAPQTGTLTFAPGEVSRVVDVIVFGDALQEADETVQLRLTGAVGAVVTGAIATGTIVNDDDGLPGLDVRPSNPDCTLLERPSGGTAGMTLVQVFPDLSLSGRTIRMKHPPGDDSTWYVVERTGRVRSFANDSKVDSSRVFLDMGSRVSTIDNQSGIADIAFHPRFRQNGEVFVSYVVPGDPYVFNISRFRSTDGGATLNVATEEVLMTHTSSNGFHFGGGLGYGPDGYLYIAMGDLGSRSQGQNLNTLPGSILRIDPDGGVPYGLPPDNPFSSGGGAPELYAWGLRNPWGWSFDRVTGELWLGDVGKDSYEEIDRVEYGGNYGWGKREGPLCAGSGCDDPAFIPPVAAFEHNDMISIIGGYVYRGAAIPGLEGTYVYADWSFGQVFALEFDRNGEPAPRVIGDTGGADIFSFAEDLDGELYVVASRKIFKLVPATSGGGGRPRDDFPRLLSELPCVDATDPSQPLDTMIPYEVAVSFWSDNGVKERFLALPDGKTVTINEDGDWDFPVGTLLMKHFRLNDRLIETRLFVRHVDGGWGGYSYEWNDQQTDAVLLGDGKTKAVDGQDWTFPSRGQCFTCHTTAAGRVLGLETVQMNHPLTYPGTGRTANQLLTLESIGVFDAPLSDEPDRLPALAASDEEGRSLEERALSYLHANCSNCHRPENPITARMNFLLDTPLDAQNACNVAPTSGDLGIPGARIVAPGDPELSVLSVRIRSLDEKRMPPIGKNVVDPRGAALIDAWIRSLATCP